RLDAAVPPGPAGDPPPCRRLAALRLRDEARAAAAGAVRDLARLLGRRLGGGAAAAALPLERLLGLLGGLAGRRRAAAQRRGAVRGDAAQGDAGGGRRRPEDRRRRAAAQRDVGAGYGAAVAAAPAPGYGLAVAYGLVPGAGPAPSVPGHGSARYGNVVRKGLSLCSGLGGVFGSIGAASH